MSTDNLDWGCRHVVGRERFQSASKVLEIGGGDFSRTFALARKYPNKNFFSVDFQYSPAAAQNVRQNADLKNANIIKSNATDKFFADNFFDFAFSIAVGEHIAQLDEFIAEMARVLTPGGEYFFIQSPYWPSSKGHHFKHWQADVQAIFQGYKHLLLSEPEMERYLRSFGTLPFGVEEALRAIYRRRDLSRLSLTETKNRFEASGLDIELWQTQEDELFDNLAAQQVLLKHEGRYSLDDIRTKGTIAACVKPARSTRAADAAEPQG